MAVNYFGQPNLGWTQIASVSMVNASTVTFDNIPQMYSELVLVVKDFYSAFSSVTQLRVNGLTGSYYDYIQTDHNGSTVSTFATAGGSAFSVIGTNPMAAENAKAIIRLPGYALNDGALNLIESHYACNSSSNHGTVLTNGTYRWSTAPVTSITLLNSPGVWLDGQATLYGVV